MRLPAGLIRRYGLDHGVQAEPMTDGILLKPLRDRDRKLGWADAGLAMAQARENWAEWETADGDGLDHL